MARTTQFIKWYISCIQMIYRQRCLHISQCLGDNPVISTFYSLSLTGKTMSSEFQAARYTNLESLHKLLGLRCVLTKESSHRLEQAVLSVCITTHAKLDRTVLSQGEQSYPEYLHTPTVHNPNKHQRMELVPFDMIRGTQLGYLLICRLLD